MVDTGGVDLGAMGNVGGSLPGLNFLTKQASRTPEYSELSRQARLPGKNYDDSPVAHTVGSDNGQTVLDGGLTDLL